MLFKKAAISTVCVSIAALFVLTGCHPKVAPPSAMDEKLSCKQLESEIRDVEQVKAQIEEKRGFSGRNVASAIFFWPGIIINEWTGSDAESAANQKLSSLKNIYAHQCMKDDNKETKKG